ncbi:MAG: hypothetical protein VX403_02290 [Planctomycetota bacterium]|nr:hypothetical protein [Planctomycetota bacterium]
MSQSLEDICPYCGTSGASLPGCAECGGLLDHQSRQATSADLGPWYVRDETRPFFPGCSLQRLGRMIRAGQVTSGSILRGPSTGGFWTRADRVPGVAVLLGRCHRCHGLVSPSGEACPACGVALGFQPGTVEPGPGAPDSLRSGTPFDLVSRAQYRRIERLQATVRTQVGLLALLVSLLFAVLVVWLAQPRPQPRFDGPVVPEGTPDPTPSASPAADPAPPGSGVLIPERPVTAEPVDPDPAGSVVAPPGDQALQAVMEVMRDVTPAQRALLLDLRRLLERGESPTLPLAQRVEALRDAQALIGSALSGERDEFFAARLTLLSVEFASLEAQLQDQEPGAP